MNDPNVICLMPTYNKFPEHGHLVEEAVQSFVLQDYPHKVLLIYNDTPKQSIRCDAENVLTLNREQRFPCLSSKLRRMIELVRLDPVFKKDRLLFARWDDDDISLPNRLSYSVDKLLSSGKEEWGAENVLYKNGSKPLEIINPGNRHRSALWSEAAVDLIGGYPEMAGGEDQHFNNRIRRIGKGAGEVIPNSEIYYIYRWGTGSFHLSGGSDLHAQWEREGQRKVKAGEYQINPHWREDYVALAKEATR